MILALKIAAMWTMVSFAAALVIGPRLRAMRRNQTVAVGLKKATRKRSVDA